MTIHPAYGYTGCTWGVVLFTHTALVVTIGAALAIVTDLPIGEIVRLLAAGA